MCHKTKPNQDLFKIIRTQLKYLKQYNRKLFILGIVTWSYTC